MPLTLNIPETTSDTDIRIESFSVQNINGTDGPKVSVTFSKGSVVNGEFIPRILEHDQLFGGTFATATFYCLVEDES